jgi:SAM-dependent methyltransferase
MRRIDVEGFEAKFRDNIDPWNYTHSHFEGFKRRILLNACGRYKHGRVLELGCAIGETTRSLARLSLRLVAVDGSSTALDEAQRRLSGANHVQFCCAVLPQEMPRGPYDLIVVSELAYYLPGHQLRPLAANLIAALAPRGFVVVLNHRRAFDDAAVLPALAHRRLRSLLKRRLRIVFDRSYGHFDVLTLQKPAAHPSIR